MQSKEVSGCGTMFVPEADDVLACWDFWHAYEIFDCRVLAHESFAERYSTTSCPTQIVCKIQKCGCTAKDAAAQEVAGLTIWKGFFSIAARIPGATWASTAWVSRHVIAVRADEVRHGNRIHHPANAPAFLYDGVRDAPVSRLKLDDMLV